MVIVGVPTRWRNRSLKLLLPKIICVVRLQVLKWLGRGSEVGAADDLGCGGVEGLLCKLGVTLVLNGGVRGLRAG